MKIVTAEKNSRTMVRKWNNSLFFSETRRYRKSQHPIVRELIKKQIALTNIDVDLFFRVTNARSMHTSQLARLSLVSFHSRSYLTNKIFKKL